jgi:hypothetical protein
MNTLPSSALNLPANDAIPALNLTVRGAKVKFDENMITLFESRKLMFGGEGYGIPFHAFLLPSKSDSQAWALLTAAQSRNADLEGLLTLARRLQLSEVEGYATDLDWLEESCEAVLDGVSRRVSADLALNLAVLRSGDVPIRVKTSLNQKSKMAVSKAVLPVALHHWGHRVLAKFQFQARSEHRRAPNGGWVEVKSEGPEHSMARDLLFHGFHGVHYNLLDEDDALRFVKDVAKAATSASKSIANFLAAQEG